METMKKMTAVFTGVLLLSLPLAAADTAAGKAVYDKSCKSCHGPDGAGNPAVAKMMKVEMKALGSKEVQAKSDADLKAVITNGEGKMKPVASVTGDQVTAVVAFVRTLK
jgi:mono/diheme cytochrome c family protein